MIAAALLVLAWGQPAAAAAHRHCYSPGDMEAEQGLLFLTRLMVVSSACHADTVYGAFRLRNRRVIIAYQRTMIGHFRRDGYRRAKRQFDTWNTRLANQISLRQGAMSTAQVCQQAAALLKTAGTLGPTGFRRYAAAQAAHASYPRCRR